MTVPKNKISSRKVPLIASPENKKVEDKKIIRIVEQAHYRSRKDINDWRAALAMAEHHEKPRRRYYIDLCEELRLDPYMINLMNRFNRHVCQHPFLLREKKSGKPDKEATKLLTKGWMYELLSYKIESKFFGHSLVEIKKIDAEGIKEIGLVERRNVVPEFGSYIPDLGEDKLINYRDSTSLNKYLFEANAGRGNKLGYLNPAAPGIMFKRNAMIAWSEFCEVFGLPIRYVVTDNTRKTDIDRIEKALRDMGKAAYGVFHTGEEMKFAETQRTDTYNVFDKLRLAVNQEITVMVLGETMTSEVGANGSRAQAEVHQDTSNEAADENRLQTEIWVNEEIMPKLDVHGYGLKNFEFYYPKQATFNANEWAVYSGLLQEYDIDEKFFIDQYGVPITGKKHKGVGDGKEKSGGNEGGTKGKEKEPNPEDDEGEPANKGVRAITNMQHLCCPDAEVHLSHSLFQALTASYNEVLKSVYENQQQINFSYCDATASLLREALWKGFSGKPATFKNEYNPPGLGVDYDTPDYLAYTMMEANIFHFSAGKTVAMVQELNALARDNKTFEEFEKAATPVMDSYSKKYLNTEYNNVWATGQNAAEYHRMRGVSDEYPYWQYLSVGDSRVRDPHRALHGKVFRWDDPIWDIIYPPNGWNCRCYVKPLAYYDESKLYTYDKAMDDLAKSYNENETQSELDKMRKSGFDKNRAELQVAFTESQQYIKKFDGSKLGVTAYNLPKWSDIDKSNLPEVPKEKTKEDAQKWYQENVANELVNDYAGRALLFSKKQFDKHLEEQYIKQERQNLVELILPTIESPDEVWFQRTAGDRFGYMYVKHLRNKMLFIPAVFSAKKPIEIKTWYLADRDVERNGILVKRKGG